MYSLPTNLVFTWLAHLFRQETVHQYHANQHLQITTPDNANLLSEQYQRLTTLILRLNNYTPEMGFQICRLVATNSELCTLAIISDQLPDAFWQSLRTRLPQTLKLHTLSIQSTRGLSPPNLDLLLQPVATRLQTLRLSCLPAESLTCLYQLIPKMPLLSTLDLPDSQSFNTAALIELLKLLESNGNFFTLGLGQRTRIQPDVKLKQTLMGCLVLIELSPSTITDPTWRRTNIEPVLARNRTERSYQQFKQLYGPKILLLILCTRRQNKPRPWMPAELYEVVLSFMISLDKMEP